jgi:hypothetical protein
LKRKCLALSIWTVTFLILALNAFYVKNARAANEYTVEWINHNVEVLYNGYVFINDTIKISGAPNSFLFGLPYQYGPHILECVAFQSADPTRRYKVTVGVPLADRMGFYGVNVSLSPQPQNGVFTVCFVLSQSLLRQDAANTSLYTLDFPAFPSLTVKASSCNASVILPPNAQRVSGTVSTFKYAENRELQPFTYEPANVTFKLATEEIKLFSVEEFRREVIIDALGGITVSDSYDVVNRSPKQITSIDVFLLPNASNISVEDEFGRMGEKPTLVDAKTSRYSITLKFAQRSMPLESGKSAKFTVKYNLPNSLIVKGETGDSTLSIAMFQNMKYYIKKVQITLAFPEGAKITSAGCENASENTTYGTMREIFQEKFTVNKPGTLFLDSLTVKVSYSYSMLWLSFRPTMWAWALATFGCAVMAIWKRPKAPTAVAVAAPMVTAKLTPETIKAFVDSYEEKRKILVEIKSLETAVSKGRIPRRRYKVQRKTLETRLTALSRKLDDLRLRLRSAGGRYADLMHQLEVAETEINEVEANIRSVENRHRRGELTLEAYRRLLADYQRRKEKAETTINGIILRLREEIR